MAQLAARQAQVAGAAAHQVVEQHDVDVERAVAEARAAAVAAVGVLERVQPVVERQHVEVAVDDRGGVDEVGALEADGRRAVGGRGADVAEALAQGREGDGDVALRVDVAAEAEAGGVHGARSGTRSRGAHMIARRARPRKRHGRDPAGMAGPGWPGPTSPTARPAGLSRMRRRGSRRPDRPRAAAALRPARRCAPGTPAARTREGSPAGGRRCRTGCPRRPPIPRRR